MANGLPSASESLASTAMETGVFGVVSAWSSAAVGASARSVLARTRKHSAASRNRIVSRAGARTFLSARFSHPVWRTGMSALLGVGLVRAVYSVKSRSPLPTTNRVAADPTKQIREAFIRKPKIEGPAPASQLPSRHHQPIKAPAVACGTGIGELHRAAQVCNRGDRLPVVQVGGPQNAINISRQTAHRKLHLPAREIVHAREPHRVGAGHQRQVMVTPSADSGNAVKVGGYVGLAA